jgi:hypothetical protein
VIALIAIAAAYGLISAILFRRLTDSREISKTFGRIVAHLLEFVLYAEEPGLVFQAQKDLLRENLRLLRLTAAPLLLSVGIFAAVWLPLDRYVCRQPAATGTVAVVATPLDRGLSSDAVLAEVPPVRVPRLNQQFWRVRVLRASPLVSRPARYSGLPWTAWFGIVAALAAGCSLYLPKI